VHDEVVVVVISEFGLVAHGIEDADEAIEAVIGISGPP
jgi:hypothetical protein